MNETFSGVGIPCGYNPAIMGSLVDGDAYVGGEITSVLFGDIIFGDLTKLVTHIEGNRVRLSDLYSEYKDKIPTGSHVHSSMAT